MINKNYIISLILLLVTELCYSQTTSDNLQDLSRHLTQLNSDIKFANKFQSVNSQMGSISKYLEKDWRKGTVISEDSSLLHGMYYRYDIRYDRIEVLSFVETDKTKMITFDGKYFVYCDFEEYGGINSGYFELLADGNCKLLLRRTTQFSEGTKEVEAYGSENNDWIKKVYYLQFGDSPALEITRKNNLIIEAFPEKQKEIGEFIKNYKLNARKLDDLTKIIKYYNIISD